MESRIEYKISLPKENEHKSFKISDDKENFKGSVYVSSDCIYISLVNLVLMPSSERRKIKEIEY